ncbi:MAG: glycoside hydrolase family 140 protein, partial [bacterium]|nr:glycoside hydrolase family 140 protein [bacterium]
FLYQADTAWMLLLGLTEFEAEEYMAARKAQGFTAIQLMLTGFADMANRANQKPFHGEADFSRPNEVYFAHVDRVIKKAQELNFYLMIAPLWAGCCGEGWAGKSKEGALKPMDKNGVAKCRQFGRFLGERYGRYPHIGWIIGGDNDPHESREVMRALAEGIKAKAPSQLMTYHAASSHSSTDVWPKEPWLDVSMVYTYFRGFDKAWNKAQPDVYEVSTWEYDKKKTKPFFLGESTYEGEHGEWGSALQVRKQAYWCLLSGGMGHAYGSPNWKMPDNWREILAYPGAASLKHLQTLMIACNWFTLVPDPNNRLVQEGAGPFARNDAAVSAQSRDKKWAVTYIPSPREINCDLTQMGGGRVLAFWFNPRTGETTEIGKFLKTSNRRFTPPDQEDWVLVFETVP